jgi:hypothetical protein
MRKPIPKIKVLKNNDQKFFFNLDKLDRNNQIIKNKTSIKTGILIVKAKPKKIPERK